jgi:hypothetical protein
MSLFDCKENKPRGSITINDGCNQLWCKKLVHYIDRIFFPSCCPIAVFNYRNHVAVRKVDVTHGVWVDPPFDLG